MLEAFNAVLEMDLTVDEMADLSKEGLLGLHWGETYPARAAAGLITTSAIMFRLANNPEWVYDLQDLADETETRELLAELEDAMEYHDAASCSAITYTLAKRLLRESETREATFRNN